MFLCKAQFYSLNTVGTNDSLASKHKHFIPSCVSFSHIIPSYNHHYKYGWGIYFCLLGSLISCFQLLSNKLHFSAVFFPE